MQATHEQALRSGIDLWLPWDEQPITVIDFETTGLDPNTCAPIEIGLARFEHGELSKTFGSFINPMMPIPEAATAVHGITDAMVDAAPTLLDLAPQIMELCKGAQPCAFNAPYDRTVLHREISGTDCLAFDPEWEWIDVFVIIASPRIDRYVSGKGRLRLGASCLRHGIELDEGHRALADATATGRLLFKLRDRGKVKPCTLARLLNHVRASRAEQDADHAAFIERMARGADK